MRHVRRADVAVHDVERTAFPVGECVRVRRAPARPTRCSEQHALGIDRRSRVGDGVEEVSQVVAFDQLHGQKGPAVPPTHEVIYGDDRGMIELGGEDRFVEKHPLKSAIARHRRQHSFERDEGRTGRRPARSREKDLGHAALAERADQLIVPGFSLQLVGVNHVRPASSRRDAGLDARDDLAFSFASARSTQCSATAQQQPPHGTAPRAWCRALRMRAHSSPTREAASSVALPTNFPGHVLAYVTGDRGRVCHAERRSRPTNRGARRRPSVVRRDR